MRPFLGCAAQATRSPGAIPRRSASPAASSTTSRAPRHVEARQGFRLRTTLMTTWSALTKTTSIGKNKKAVWIDQPGRSTSPSPGLSSRLPRRPRGRRNVVSATTQRSQTTLPSSSRRRTSAPGCPATLVPRGSEDLADRISDRAEQDDEHRRKDEEHEREENLDR